jgi:hypothetical protein
MRVAFLKKGHARRSPPNERRHTAQDGKERSPTGTRSRPLVHVSLVAEKTRACRRSDDSGGGGLRCRWWCASRDAEKGAPVGGWDFDFGNKARFVWSWRALATGTAWAGTCLIHNH